MENQQKPQNSLQETSLVLPNQPTEPTQLALENVQPDQNYEIQVSSVIPNKKKQSENGNAHQQVQTKIEMIDSSENESIHVLSKSSEHQKLIIEQQTPHEKIPWKEFVKQVETFGCSQSFLQKLRKCIQTKGQFSPIVLQTIRDNFKPPALNKIINAYKKIFLNIQIETIFVLLGIQIGEVQGTSMDALYKGIGQGNQDAIVQFVEQNVDQNNPHFKQSTRMFLKFYKQPQTEIDTEIKHENLPSVQEQHTNSEEKKLKLILDEKKLVFKKFLQSKSITIPPQFIDQIMTLNFNNGPFSKDIDEYIKKVPNLKKPQITKLQRAFDEFFRKIQFPEDLSKQLKELEFEEDDIKSLKQQIIKGDVNQIRETLSGYFQQNQKEQLQTLVSKILDLRSVEPPLKRSNVQRKITQRQNIEQSLNKANEANDINGINSFEMIKDQKERIQEMIGQNKKFNENKSHSLNKQNFQIQEGVFEDIDDKSRFPVDSQEQYNKSNKKGITNETSKQSKTIQQKKVNFDRDRPQKSSQQDKKIKFKEKQPTQNQQKKSEPQKSKIQILKNTRIEQKNKQVGQKHVQTIPFDDQQQFPKIGQNFNQHEFRQFKRPGPQPGRNNKQQHNQNLNFIPVDEGLDFKDRDYSSKDLEGRGYGGSQTPQHLNREKSGQFRLSWDQFTNKVQGINSQNHAFQVRYFLLVCEKGAKLHFRKTKFEELDLTKSNQIQYHVSNQVIAKIYRIQISSPNEQFELEIPNSYWIPFLDKKIRLHAKDFLQSYLNIQQALDRSKFERQRHEIYCFYLFTVLNQLSKERQYDAFWNTLIDFRRYMQPQSPGMIQILAWIQHVFHRNPINFSSQCSRLLIYFIAHQMRKSAELERIDSEIINFVSLILNFQENGVSLPVFPQNYTYEYETRLILNCMFVRCSKKLSIQEHVFIQNIQAVFGLSKKVQQKLKLIHTLQRCCQQRIQEIYYLVKDLISPHHIRFIDYIILRLNLLNVDKFASKGQYQKNYHQKSFSNQRFEQLKRNGIIQMIKQIKLVVDHMREEDITIVNQQLKQLNHSQNKDLIKDVLLGKNSSNQNFLLNHQHFYNFYTDLISMRQNRRFNLYQYFEKCLSYDRRIKAIEHIILRTQKYPEMISFICSIDKDSQKQLKNLIRKFDNKSNLLGIIQCWYKSDFKPQNNDFFIEIFSDIMKNAKQEYFTPLELMRLLDKFVGNQIMKSCVEKLAKKIFVEMKRLPQFFDLKIQLLQIKQIKKSIKTIYLEELSIRLQQSKPALDRLEKVTCEVICQGNIEKNDRQIVLRKLFQNRNDKPKQQIKQEIIDYYTQGKRQMKVLGYYNNFKKTLNELIQEIQNRELPYSIIQNMKKQKTKIIADKYVQQFKKMAQLLDQIVKEIETTKRKTESLVRVFKSYDKLFINDIADLQDWIKKLPTNRVRISQKNIRKFSEYLEASDQINSLMKIPLWDFESIKKMKDILLMKDKTIQDYKKLIQSFEKQTLSFNDFKKNFKIDILATLLENIKGKDENLKDKLREHINYLDDRTLKYCVISINSINEICKQVENKIFFQSTYLQIVQFLQKPTENITIQKAFKKIKQVTTKFEQVGFNILDEEQQILKTLIHKCNYKRVFDMIAEKKIDSNTVLNDLKQYINDVQNSILKIQDIKELQQVVLFYELLGKANNFKIYLKKLRQQVKLKRLRLSENIYNIDSKVKQFEQMIDSSANRQTSFKYDLQEIFKYSQVRIKNQHGFAHVQIEIMKNLIQQKQKNSKQQLTIFSFKKLTQFKDKAILLVSDFERSAQNQGIMQQTIELFRDYLSLYKILQQIELSLEKAIIYGYNPEYLEKKEQIKEKNYKEVQKMKIQVQNLSKDWIQGMKQMYEQSYLLTHFMGPKLNAFINDTLNFKFSPLIKRIVDLDEQQFGKRLDSLQFIGLQTDKCTPIDKVKQICKIFKKVQIETLKRFQRSSLVEQTQIKSKIQLITSHTVQNYYFALVKGNSTPEMNQILYCQKQTSFEEIQVFIKRSIIKNHRKHYFIGAHYLPVEVQLKFIDLLNQYLRTKEKRQRFTRSKLCFIDNSPREKVYLHLCKKQLFDSKQITDTHLKTHEEINYVLKNIGQTYLIESKIPGLGKTFWAQKKKPKANIVYFSIAGHIHFSRLLQRLKSKKFDETRQNTFIIQIGHVENKNKLEIFLFQLIFFKGFNFKEFFFLPKATTVVVQIQNVYDTENIYEYYSILKIIKQQRENYIFIDRFKLEQLQPRFDKLEESFVYYYLISIYNKSINEQEKTFEQFEAVFKKNPNNLKICSKDDARKLIKYFFCSQLEQNKTEPTFALYKSFVKLLFTAFKTFSQNGCFNIHVLQSNHRSNRNLNLINVRLDFLICCIRNCLQFLQATINTNQFKEEGQTKAKQNKPREDDFRDTLSKFPFLIMPAHDFHNYEFVYLNSEGVDVSIKSLIISQSIYKYIRKNSHGYDKPTLERRLDLQIVKNLFSESALERLEEQTLEREIYRILHQLSGNQLFNVPDKTTIKEFKGSRQNIQNYSITLDNFFKMCLIVQRAISHIPIVIQGESGVGKTALISFLVQTVFGHRLQIFNIHAGIDEEKLVKYYHDILEASHEVKDTKQKVWVFFDEFNTTDELSYIKEMIIDRKFQGQPIPDNVVLIGACNPYRRKNETNFKRAGIKKKLAQNNISSENNLAFKVKPPSLSMIQFMWDYQQLKLKQNLHYISKILESLTLKEHQKVVQTIAFLHEHFKTKYEISSVSLRDVTRFKQLYLWFMQKMPKREDPTLNYPPNPNYSINTEQRAISLSLAFCYSLRIADKNQRKQLLKAITKQLEFENEIEKVVQNQQIDYVQRLKISTQRIAINFSLRQNVFTTLVCLMNKIPILIIGNPGNSKSLSIRMISSNLRGLNSESKFCKDFPELSIIYFQGSQACTSKGVEAVFEKAISSNKAFKQKKKNNPGLGEVQNCVLFDQIGLAQKSIHNPLKVLHSKLQTNKKEICFIGISNWQLDAAKMSRFLVLSRSNPEKQELRDTAIKILESYMNRDSYKHEKTFRQMSDWYYEFVEKWDLQHKDSFQEGFFGLRDFYCYIKFVAAQLQKQSTLGTNDIIRKAIQTNFDGQEGSVEMFLQIAGLTKIDDDRTINPIRLVEENLCKDSSRSLLLIVRGDALLPIIKDKLKIKGEKQRIECIYGSTFALDQQSEQYNLEITSIIISHMSRGTVLTFKNPNNSIQTSLYDVFNKSFTFSGPKKYCRVAVGANSNPKCVVHQSFGSIVFMDEEVIKNTDLAFLNRFEKHFLTLSNVLSTSEKQFVSEINSWIQQLIRFKNKTQYKKQEHYLINSSEQSIVTLVIKYRRSLENYRESGIKKIKKALLKNATEHFYIALKAQDKNYIALALRNQIKELLKENQNEKEGKLSPIDQTIDFEDILQEEPPQQDKIIFTYDEGIFSAVNYLYCTQKTLRIRISEVKSQRQLRKSLKIAFSTDKYDNIHILLDFQKQSQHINFIAFLLTGIKNEFKSQKTIYIIIRLSQSSLQNAGRDHLNISYLLDFEQMFIDSLTFGGSFMEVISNKTIKQLYIERKMQENFDNLYIQAQKRFKLIQNQKDILKGMSASQIKDFQFGEMMKMNENQIFRKQALAFIEQNLSEDKIDLSIILNNKEDRNLCNSPQESFEKYLQNSVINTICLFFDRIYRNNLLFAFDMQKLFEFYKKSYDIKILELIYQQIKDEFDQFLLRLLETYVKNRELASKQYKRAYDSNPLQMKGLCLLPMALRQLQYISSASQDSLFKNSSKILELSVSSEVQSIQQCQLETNKCIAILNEKSVFLKNSLAAKSHFDFEKFLNENDRLQIFYFFDMISKIYSESINTDVLPLQKLVYLFVRIFRKLQIKQKVIFLALNKELWSNIFNIWSLWITHREENFHRQMETHYLKNKIIDQQRNQPHELPKLLIELCRSTLVLQEDLLRLDIRTIQKYGIYKYLSFFRKTYFYIQKIRLTCMDLNVQVSETMKATKRFFDLLDKIYEKDQIEEELTLFLTIRTQGNGFEPKVVEYLSTVLENQNKNKERSHILSYLSLEIYSSWIKRLQEQMKKSTQVEEEVQSCIKTFIFYSDKHESFANNSSFFLQNVFAFFIDDLNTIQEKVEYLENGSQDDQMIQIINDELMLRNNFAVCLGNFFMDNIKSCIEGQEFKEQQRKEMGMREQNKESFINRFFNLFQTLIKKNCNKNKVLEIFIIEFLKYYCVRYLDAITLQQDRATTWNVDLELQHESMTVEHLRLYLLKIILYREQKMTVIKQNYLDNKRCKWLERFREQVSGKSFELLVPPPFEEESTKMTELIKKFREEQYEKMDLFVEILKESLQSPITKYEFLTFMMNDIYTRLCPEDRVIRITEIINSSQQYKKGQNIVEHNLLKCYLNHRVSEVLKYQASNQLDKSQKRIQDFVTNQLIYLNFINIFVACSTCECPLIEMFFDMGGNVPENYVDWLQKRFLVNGRENQSASILKRFIELGDNTPGYYKCSTKCDMFYTIGGSGGFGCQLPRVEGRCGWCNGIIGGTNHILTRASQGARKVELAGLPAELQVIREKRRLQILNHKLNGYSYSCDTKQMIKQVQSNRRLPESVKYILQQMIFSIWSFLSSSNLIDEPSIKQIFKINGRAFQLQSYQIMREFNQLAQKSLNLSDEQQNIVWHLGVSQEIMKFMMSYKSQLSNEMKQKMGLVRCIGRDTFEEYLVNNVILRFSSGNQKLALINRSRCVRAGVNLSGQEVFRQTGGYEIHLEKYPKIRLIKLLHEDKSPCYENLIKQYRQIINRDYKILAYYIQKQQEIEILDKYRIIYTFCTKILKIFSMKITRRDAKTKTILKLYEQLHQNTQGQEQLHNITSNINTFREQVMEFCQVWNELRKMKFDLRYGCHSLGLMNQVTAELDVSSKAINFFPDSRYKGDQRGEMLLSLLQVTSQQYNEVCSQINHLKTGEKKYRQIEILNIKPINPTQVQPLTKTLSLNRQLIQQQFVSNSSNWSVEYGCGLPHYSIDKIQSLIVEHIVGSHILNEEIKEYDSINFIGQQLNFITEIRQLENQKEWQSMAKREEIQKHIYTLKHEEPDSFLKEITSIKGSLQLILHYCRLQKGAKFTQMTIGNFIQHNKIKITSKTLSEELFYSLQMEYILGLYEFIELQTLSYSAECLDDSYKKDKLTQIEEKHIKSFLTQLKNQYKAEDDIFYHISIALYRFVARSLLLVEIKETLLLFHFLYEGADLWPYKFDIDKLAGIRHFQQAFSIPMTKMQSLLDLIPLEIKKTKTQVLLIDQKKTSQETTRQVKLETLERQPPKKKKNL